MASLLRQRQGLPSDMRVADRTRDADVGNDSLPPTERLELYRRQFWLRHTASLLEVFPGLASVLGDADWERLVAAYLDEIAPTSWTLGTLGSRMPAHVERSTWLPQHELCVDVARLEWAYVEISDAPEAPQLAPGAIALRPVDLSGWELEMSPALALLRVTYPVTRLLRRIRAGNTILEMPPREPENLVIHRDVERNPATTAVSDAAFELLELLVDGAPLARASECVAERLGRSPAELAPHVAEWCGEFARRGWVIGVKHP